MINKKCCNHSLIQQKLYFECPICHKKYDLNIETDDIKKDNNSHVIFLKDKMLYYIKNNIISLELLLKISNEIIDYDPNNFLAKLILSFININNDNIEFNNNLNLFISNQKDNEDFEVIINFLISNIEYKFFSYIEEKINEFDLNSVFKEKIKKAKIKKQNESIENVEIFICYEKTDLNRVINIVQFIENNGFTCWYYDRNMLKNNFILINEKEIIEKAIINSKIFLVVNSKECMYSKDVNLQVDIALKNSISNRIDYLIKPVKYSKKFKNFLKESQCIDAINTDNFKTLLKQITHYISNNEIEENNVDNNQNGDNNIALFPQNNLSELINKNEKITEFIDNQVQISQSNDNEDINHIIKEFEIDNILIDYFEENDRNIYEREEGIRLFNQKEYEKALNYLLKCNKDSEVNYYLGMIYLNKDSSLRNYQLAYKFFMNSSDERLFEEMNELGKKFYVIKQYEEAIKCFTKSAKLKNEKAICNLAFCYLFGNGVRNDINYAGEKFKEAADLGNAVAMYEYANICFNKDSKLYNLNEARNYLLQAANMNNVDAQYSIGVCYYRGYGVKKDKDEALKWLNKAISNDSEKAKRFKETHYQNIDEFSALELDDEAEEYYDFNDELKLDNEIDYVINDNFNEFNNEDLIEKAKKSVVKISVEFKEKEGYASGSGWLAYKNLIITNAHVITPKDDDVVNNIICEFDPDLKLKNNKICLDSVPVYVSINEDIAILKPLNSNVPCEIPVLRISEKPVKLGEKVFTIGSPLNYDFTCMEGIVANLNYKHPDSESLYNYLQTTLILNKGNSGGAVFNTKGEVVGMATFNDIHPNPRDGVVISEQGMLKGKIITNDTINGYGFCVKREALLDALDKTIKNF